MTSWNRVNIQTNGQSVIIESWSEKTVTRTIRSAVVVQTLKSKTTFSVGTARLNLIVRRGRNNAQPVDGRIRRIRLPSPREQ